MRTIYLPAPEGAPALRRRPTGPTSRPGPTDRQAAALALRGRGYTYEQIAYALGVSDASAYHLCKRGRKRALAVHLAEKGRAS